MASSSLVAGRRGLRVSLWMDTDVQQALTRCWAGFERDDQARALLATTELYRCLADRTAAALGLPVFDHERVAAEVRTILG